MQRRVQLRISLTAASSFFFWQHRSYYDKVRREREKSDDTPCAMFDEFPKNPHASSVPNQFRTPNADAVKDAELLQRGFLLSLVVMLFALFYSGFLDPFNEGYRRPDGYGMPAVEKSV
ncbi:hypothetical protein, conserved [Trypanosoma brucei brucei TREU927]|uniref:Transmembrane protein n=3 Tax=Trypanosoma brucei TaxID=5691 RepID=Q38FE9_TRYB2|nr:hypothetical protein, conserved [Trypanosoma brucei brucei TREU927]EAN76471.1 hypothetical protein, conserved [Trypanosoma brucei brucei TREU927]RHW70095.1 hypothetical protein DPX39_090015000 [Trypanosoma brucei equiperdum]